MRDLNFKFLAERKGATVTARFGKDGITLCYPNNEGEDTTRAAPPNGWIDAQLPACY